MANHALGGPSKYNAAEEFWKQRITKEANRPDPASADPRNTASFANTRSTLLGFPPSGVATRVIPRAGNFRGPLCRNFAETSTDQVFAGGGTIVASAVYKPPEKDSSYHVISTDSMSD